MKNLEQIRAQQALEFWRKQKPAGRHGRNESLSGKAGGDVVSGLAPFILSNGLLATAAFARKKGGGHETLMREVGRFLGDRGPNGRAMLPRAVSSLDDFIAVLVQNDSFLLQRAAIEALAYLGYLKRFAADESSIIAEAESSTSGHS